MPFGHHTDLDMSPADKDEWIYHSSCHPYAFSFPVVDDMNWCGEWKKEKKGGK